MSFNCKPGDIAILVRDQIVKGPSHFCSNDVVVARCGIIVKVVELSPLVFDHVDGPVWLIEEPFTRDGACPQGNAWTVLIRGLQDANLRPLRDPGENAQTDNPVKLKEPA